MVRARDSPVLRQPDGAHAHVLAEHSTLPTAYACLINLQNGCIRFSSRAHSTSSLYYEDSRLSVCLCRSYCAVACTQRRAVFRATLDRPKRGPSRSAPRSSECPPRPPRTQPAPRPARVCTHGHTRSPCLRGPSRRTATCSRTRSPASTALTAELALEV